MRMEAVRFISFRFFPFFHLLLLLKGSISVSEFKAAMEKFHCELSLDEITELVRELDVDGDGEISEEEFAILLEKHAELTEGLIG